MTTIQWWKVGAVGALGSLIIFIAMFRGPAGVGHLNLSERQPDRYRGRSCE